MFGQKQARNVLEENANRNLVLWLGVKLCELEILNYIL